MSSFCQSRRPCNLESLRPQRGKQEQFLSSSADLCIYGGAAGGGKTYGIILESLRHKNIPNYTCGIFRRNYKQIFDPGGLWALASDIYPKMGGYDNISRSKWKFPSGACISFHSLAHEKDKNQFQGSQFCGIFFDELTHFTETQFTYMFSRNRSMCGVRPYIRATCNPQTEGFVRDLVDWWIGSDGLPREERSGAIRYAVRDGDTLLQFDQLEHIPIKRRDEAKTISFINSSVYDNEVLLKNDPGYLANLKSLPRYDREQLLNGNWNIRREAGMYFRESWFEIVEKVPPAEEINMVCCRYWDRAATTPKEGLDPDYTVGIKLGRSGDTFYVLDIIRIRETPLFVAKRIKSASMMDGYSCTVGLEQEGGASGIAECDYLKRDLDFPNVEVAKAEKSKEWRCKPVSAASEQGRVKLLLAPWNKAFLSELENFPLGAHDDQVDALSGAFNMLDRKPDYSVYKSLARARGLL